MAHLQVTCINKHPMHRERHRHIEYIGGYGWKHSQADAIRYIETRANTYYTNVGGYSANVIVATHNGNKYLKTDRDTTLADNLLSLPECR